MASRSSAAAQRALTAISKAARRIIIFLCFFFASTPRRLAADRLLYFKCVCLWRRHRCSKAAASPQRSQRCLRSAKIARASAQASARAWFCPKAPGALVWLYASSRRARSTLRVHRRAESTRRQRLYPAAACAQGGSSRSEIHGCSDLVGQLSQRPQCYRINPYAS